MSKSLLCVAVVLAVVACAGGSVAFAQPHLVAGRSVPLRLAQPASSAASHQNQPATADEGPAEERPWVEGVNPTFEDRLFRLTYASLPSHNILKVYAIEVNGYESAGIRFSARVPHESRDLSEDEISHEAATLIRLMFENYPSMQTVDIWGTIPVPVSEAHSVDSTVFSVSADRDVYERIRDSQGDDLSFLHAFGHLWIAPAVPR